MRNLWDGFLSFLACFATIGLCGVPVWFTFRSIQLGIAPTWAYVPVVGLAVVGVVLAYAFFEKGLGGVSPSRTRRRR